jgi:hypothetical protein
MLTVAVAAGAGDILSAATDDDDKPNMLRAGSDMRGDWRTTESPEVRADCSICTRS